MKKAFFILIWAICVILGLDLAFGWLNLACTIANVGGLFLVFAIICVSIIFFKKLFKIK
jgi:hypothetical protein